MFGLAKAVLSHAVFLRPRHFHEDKLEAGSLDASSAVLLLVSAGVNASKVSSKFWNTHLGGLILFQGLDTM